MARLTMYVVGNASLVQLRASLSEVVDALQAKRCVLGVLTPAASVADVEVISARGERMPQKSTYFYPKLQTGLVFNSLTTN